MTVRVLVTARSFANAPGEHQDYLQRNGYEVDLRAKAHPLTAAELGVIIGEYEGAILGIDNCDVSVIERAARLRVISRAGSGVDQVDLDAAARRNIVVTNTPGANRIAVAELTIGLMFALARNIPQTAAAARINQWKRDTGFELSGKTLGIIGLGLIGREVATRAPALGMTVLGYDPFVTADIPGVRQVDLSTLLSESNIVTLHCAATPETENLLNAERLALMRDGAYLINTARGALVDEKALYHALRSGKLAGAAADALRDDPPMNNPLLALENFFYTPHIGATTRESVERVSMMAAQNLVAVLRGDPCPYIVNAHALKLRR
ncbi:MAG: phosphoglycerate dehydrogenase [Aggregatilineales bacterium]